MAIVCLAFPLHPPGSPDKSRLSELLTPEIPVLVLQGERDTFGSAATLAAEVGARPSIRIIPIPGADHSMKVLASSPLNARAVAELVTSSVAGFIGDAT
jgi:predicted alpha/beta-hydrolase family hydrolase